MLDPNPEIANKIAQQLGSGWIGNAIGVLLGLACGFAAWLGEKKKSKAEITTSDLSAALANQLQERDGFKTLNSIEILLKDIHLELGRMNDGIEYLGKLYEATFTEKKLQVPVKRNRKRPG